MQCDGFAGVARDIGYLFTLGELARAAVSAKHEQAAAQLYALLRPYATFNAVSTTAMCLGSVSHSLGALARFAGRRTDAEAHFEDARAMNERMGYRMHALRSQLALASLLAEGSSMPKRKRAEALAVEVIGFAHAHGMRVLATRAARLAESCRARL